MSLFKKILIANRGEIAVRIIKTLKKMNIASVAVFSEKDRNALFVEMADESVFLPGDTLQETYLNIDAIINAALNREAQAIHPGYGFLSENADFAAKVSAEGLKFIGPTAKAISIMGDKLKAREMARNIKVPLIEGFEGSKKEILKKSSRFNYPLLVKAAAGGGGKAMQIVRNPEELPGSVEVAENQAIRYFANGLLYVERYFEDSRHIEVQVLVDKKGNVYIPGERECTVQRRYQKVVEEAPSPSVTENDRKQLWDVSKRICKAISYENAGTLEFLMDAKGNFYFLEMNTRIQVEHPVTEITSGIDIVEQQVNIAAGKKVDIPERKKTDNSHAIEVRLYAEDPEKEFLPSSGKIYSYHEPELPESRIDSGINGPSEIHPDYDPLIAKVIASGKSRNQAIKNLISTLSEFHISGPVNNKEFLLYILKNKDFKSNTITTTWLEKKRNVILKDIATSRRLFKDFQVLSLWLADKFHHENNHPEDVWKTPGFREHRKYYYPALNGINYIIELDSFSLDEFTFIIDKFKHHVKVVSFLKNYYYET